MSGPENNEPLKPVPSKDAKEGVKVSEEGKAGEQQKNESRERVTASQKILAEKKPKVIATKKEREEKEAEISESYKSMRDMYSGNESFADDWEKTQMQISRDGENSATKEYLTQAETTLQLKKGEIRTTESLDSLDPEEKKAAHAAIVRQSITLDSLSDSTKKATVDELKKTKPGFDTLPQEEQDRLILLESTKPEKIQKAIEAYELAKIEALKKDSSKPLTVEQLDEIMKKNLGLQNLTEQQRASVSLDILKKDKQNILLNGEPALDIADRVLTERVWADMIQTLGNDISWDTLPETIKQQLVTNPRFALDINEPSHITAQVQIAKQSMIDGPEEGESPSEFEQRFQKNTGFKTADRGTVIERASRSAGGSGGNSFLKTLALFFAHLFPNDPKSQAFLAKYGGDSASGGFSSEYAKHYGVSDGQGGGQGGGSSPSEDFSFQNNIPENKEVEIKKVSLQDAIALARKSYNATPEALRAMRFTSDGKLIKYVIEPPGKIPRNGGSDKKFIAVHGTMSYSANQLKRNGGNREDSDLDSSGLNMGHESGLYQYLVSHKGLVFQFFDDENGHGAVGPLASRSNTTGVNNFNSQGIGIELSLAGSNTSTTLEKTTAEQLESTRALIGSIRTQHNIGAGNVITSADPVRDKRTGQLVGGAHSDDYSAEDRKAMGIASYQSIRSRLDSGKFFSDDLSRNGQGKYESTPTLAQMSPSDVDGQIQLIKNNESGNTKGNEGYAWWNDDEHFPSMGFAHFIWGTNTNNGNSFHEMMKYITSKKGISVPTNLSYLMDENPPWSATNGKDGRAQMKADARYNQTADFLAQADVKRAGYDYIQNSRLASLSKNLTGNTLAKFNMLARGPKGSYILTDYVNFKGEGTPGSAKSWGLVNVLENMDMPSDPQDAARRFSESAKSILMTRRPAAYAKNGRGWSERMDTYL